MPTILAPALQTFAVHLLTAGGATFEEASRVGRSLVDANLRGYESHGVMRIPYYVQAIVDGEVVPRAEFTITKQSPTHVVADANWGFGQVQADRLLEQLADRSHASGVGVGTMIHS